MNSLLYEDKGWIHDLALRVLHLSDRLSVDALPWFVVQRALDKGLATKEHPSGWQGVFVVNWDAVRCAQSGL